LLAVISPNTKPAGEMQSPQHLNQKQLTATIPRFFGNIYS